MIDFHNHILPCVDDGSNSLEMSIKMLKKASSDGISTIVNTSHFQHPKIKDRETEFIVKQKRILEDAIKIENLNISLIQGKEIYYDLNLTTIIEHDFALIAKKYMLVEFDPFILPATLEERFFILQTLGITPIIAHPERYLPVQKNISIAKRWARKDYILQINAPSILGYFGKECQKTSIELIENSLCDLIGSDAHNDSSRNFFLKDAFNYLDKNFKKGSCEALNENAKLLINGQDLKKIQFDKKNKFWFF